MAKRTPPKNKLTEEERKEVLRVANSSEYRDLVPNQIVPKLADQGIYLASESTFHRILKEEKLNTFRLRSKETVKREPATHVATSPNQGVDVGYYMAQRTCKGPILQTLSHS